MVNPKISSTYDGLVRQFKALLSLCKCQEKELTYLRNKDYSLSEEKFKELHSLLESEKDMNDELTKQIEVLERA